jgi:segregation and condensation protein A
MSVAVETPNYSGPFDLLLQLILKEQVDIHEVSLSVIVDQFLAEVERLQALDLDVATEFLLIAATLVELKTRRLLPGAADVDLDEELALWEERDLLVARLLECKTFQDVAKVFATLAERADRSFARAVGPDERFEGLAPDLLEGTSVERLQRAAIKSLTPTPVPVVDLHHVNPVRFTVAEAVAELVEELPRWGRVSFRRLTANLADRIEIIVQFLAVLELYKQGYLDLEQAELFGEIEISWTGGSEIDPDQMAIDDYDG